MKSNDETCPTVEAYLRAAADARRASGRRVGAVFGVGALFSAALACVMSDIGHAAGFFGMSVALSVSGVFAARRLRGDA